MEDTWELLWRLQELDRGHALALKERESAAGPAERAKLSRAVTEAQHRRDRMEEELKRAKSQFRQAELDLRAAEDRLAQTEKRLYSGGVTNAKELSQLENRVAEERAQRARVEEEYLASLDGVEEGERLLAAAVSEAERLRLQLAELERDLDARARHDRQVDRDYLDRRAEIVLRLPDQQREKYERIQARHPGSALVRIQHGSCGGCHNALAQAEIERAARFAGLSTCENCGRLLAPESKEDLGRRD